MAFCTTYNTILDNNLKYIYTGVSDTRNLKAPFHFPVIHSQKQTSTSKQSTRGLEYSHEHNLYIPKAPAFQVLSKENVDKIVERVYRPRTSQKDPDETISEYETSGSRQKQPVSPRRVKDIQKCSDRLAKQQTVSTEIRRSLTESSKATCKTPISDIKLSCVRMHKSVSQRYYPRAYKQWCEGTVYQLY